MNDSSISPQSSNVATPANSSRSSDRDAAKTKMSPDAATKAPMPMQNQSQHPCSDGALRIATRICSEHSADHQIILMSGLAKKNLAGPTALETATALAMMGEGKVLLVDADANKPFLGDLLRAGDQGNDFGKLGPPGLSQVLNEQADLNEVLLTGSVPNLDFLAAGDTIDPAWFLSERCGAIMKSLREQYSFVIVVSAPVLQSPESMRLATHCDGLAAVVTSGKQSQQDLRQLANDLSALSIPMLGVIVASR